MSLAAIDCGTNSIRVLIADVDPDTGDLHEHVREMTVVRLGEGLGRTGRISAAALERTFAACDDYAHLMRTHNVEAVRFVATSASRDAENSDEFVTGVQQRMGCLPEVISGQEEARLSFLGATSSVDAPSPRLVVDIGGGSTEFVLGDTAPQSSISVDMGCVRFTERHVQSDPPTPAERDAIIADTHRALDDVAKVIPLRDIASVIGLAGTVTTITALALGLDMYDSQRIHGSRVTATEVDAWVHRLAEMTVAERRDLAVMHPGRADVIVAGGLIWATILSRIPTCPVYTSEHDILDGVIYDLASQNIAQFAWSGK